MLLAQEQAITRPEAALKAQYEVEVEAEAASRSGNLSDLIRALALHAAACS